MAKENGKKFGAIASLAGALLIALSMFQFYVNPVSDYLMSVNSDIFGIGGAFLVVGVVFIFFKVKIT